MIRRLLGTVKNRCGLRAIRLVLLSSAIRCTPRLRQDYIDRSRHILYELSSKTVGNAESGG